MIEECETFEIITVTDGNLIGDGYQSVAPVKLCYLLSQRIRLSNVVQTTKFMSGILIYNFYRQYFLGRKPII